MLEYPRYPGYLNWVEDVFRSIILEGLAADRTRWTRAVLTDGRIRAPKENESLGHQPWKGRRDDAWAKPRDPQTKGGSPPALLCLVHGNTVRIPECRGEGDGRTGVIRQVRRGPTTSAWDRRGRSCPHVRRSAASNRFPSASGDK